MYIYISNIYTYIYISNIYTYIYIFKIRLAGFDYMMTVVLPAKGWLALAILYKGVLHRQLLPTTVVPLPASRGRVDSGNSHLEVSHENATQ